MIAQQTPDVIVGLLGMIWCFALVLAGGQFVVFIIALVQILSRHMPAEAKILWAVVAWFLPLIGPILWWTIGSKQHPRPPTAPPP